MDEHTACAGLTILHAGALGDLVLVLHLARRLTPRRFERGLRLISRVDPGLNSEDGPPLARFSAEGLGLHWLYQSDAAPSPTARLEALVTGQHVLNLLCGPGDRAHARLGALRPAALISIDPRPAPGSRRHITEQWAHTAEQQGAVVEKCTQHARGGALLRVAHGPNTATALATSPSARRVVIHPGSGGVAKCWPIAGFIEVACAMGSQNRVTFLLGPAELERWDAREVDALCNRFDTVALDESANPRDLTVRLASADVYLGNDSGPTHLAAALGVKTLALFGPTDPGVWAPLGPRVSLLRGDPARSTWGLSVDQVLAALG